MQTEYALTPEAREAMRAYLIRLFAIPGVIGAVVAFALGYFIRDIAHKKAEFEVGREAQVQIGEMLSRANEGLIAFAEETGQQKVRAEQAIEETERLTEALARVKTDIAVLDQLKNIETFVPNIVQTLQTDETFVELVRTRQISMSSCAWGEWKQKWDLEIERSCPANGFVRSVGFKHGHGQNGTHEESVRVECCSIVVN